MSTHRLSDRAFGFTFSGVFAFITFIGWSLFDVIVVWAIATSITFGIITLAKPSLLMPLNRLWGVLAPRIAAITNGIVLGLAFYLVVTPMGILMRLFKKDPMYRRFEKKPITYWTPVLRQGDRENFHDMF